MPKFCHSSLVRDVVRAEEEGRARYGRGDLAGAIERYELACGLVREILEATPSDPPSITQLAAMLYTLGQWQLEAVEHGDAIESLDEAEELYGKLGHQAAGRIADVVIRRAIVNMELGMPLSAIADAQQAVTASLDWGEQDPAARELDVARVLALAGHVELRIGADPDLAVGAADWALESYQRLLLSGGKFSLPAGHTFAFKMAVQVSAIAHTVAGRTALAGPMRELAIAANGGTWPEFDDLVQRVRDRQPTLAQVLTAAGEADLAEKITGTSTGDDDYGPMVPALRCEPELTPAVAFKLADILQGSGVPEQARALLGLESHALFAAASRLQVPRMRYQFGGFGQNWAAAVLNVGKLNAGRGKTTVAYDAVKWLAGIVGQLEPYAMTDSGTRGVAAECARWRRDVYAVADSSSEEVRTLTSLVESLEGQPER
jgi:tetratricopeptide (TPR) repeat protein